MRIIKKKNGKKFKLASFTSLAKQPEPLLQGPQAPMLQEPMLPGRRRLAPGLPRQAPELRQQASQPGPEPPKESPQRLPLPQAQAP